MKPETLKRIAEALGYKTDNRGGEIIAYGWGEYDPESNPAQLLEIIEWLKSTICCTSDGVWIVYNGTDDFGLAFPSSRSKGKTLAEAVLAAAEEHVK